MFKLSHADAMKARARVMDACMEDVEATHVAYTNKSDESLEMHATLSDYKYKDSVLFKIYTMRMKSFDELEAWTNDVLLRLIDIMGEVVVSRHLAFYLQHYYIKAVGQVDAFLQLSLLDLDSLEAASVEMEVARSHDTYKELVACMVPDFAISMESFCGKYSVPVSLDLAALVNADTAAPLVWTLVEQSRDAFEGAWSKEIAESQATTIMQEARIRALEVGLQTLRKAACVSTYRRSVLSVVFKFQDGQFCELQGFVDDVFEDCGVFADGTGSHIQSFVQRELVASTASVDKKINCKATTDAWATEMIEIEDKHAAESLWLDTARTGSGCVFHVIVKGDVENGTAIFRDNVNKAALDFGLCDAKFRNKYMPDVDSDSATDDCDPLIPETGRVVADAAARGGEEQSKRRKSARLESQA